jgi:hypothetical protein
MITKALLNLLLKKKRRNWIDFILIRECVCWHTVELLSMLLEKKQIIRTRNTQQMDYVIWDEKDRYRCCEVHHWAANEAVSATRA